MFNSRSDIIHAYQPEEIHIMSEITLLTVHRIKFIMAVKEAVRNYAEDRHTVDSYVKFLASICGSYVDNPEAKHFSDPLFAALFSALDNNSKVIVKDWLMFSTHNPSMVTVAKFFYRDDPKKVSFGIVNCTFVDVCNAPILAEWVQLK